MKTKILFFACVMALPFLALSQSCLPEGITFNTQSQVDSFQINYPGCTEIEGDVRIGSWSFITSDVVENLNGLNNVTSIGGNLEIGYWDKIFPVDKTYLHDLEGLNNLNYIGGDLSISSQDSLQTLEGMEGLITIGGNLSIGDYEGNPILSNLTGLDNVESIEGGLRIVDNPDLATISALSNLTNVYSIWVGSNWSLMDLTGLEGLSVINGGLYISNTSSPFSLIGLNNLTSINGKLRLASTTLTSLADLENLEFIGGDLEIRNNLSLSTCHIQAICDYLSAPNGSIRIEWNDDGCRCEEEVKEACDAMSIKDLGSSPAVGIFPNPFDKEFNLTGALENTSEIIMSIHDSYGRMVLQQHIGNQSSGNFTWTFNASGLPPGLYLCRLQSGNQSVVKRIVKL
ncbi:MAG: T9SS type A sorting domain-containing protein [Bacteroidales bacterium]|nr:T9SS type A sorting domain-containing protein [Bacteroidales bacterium]